MIAATLHFRRQPIRSARKLTSTMAERRVRNAVVGKSGIRVLRQTLIKSEEK